ncbi:MAG: 2-amino-4-hydroxy-6-hydroxymethyldihydropteridine diphosphokinase [Sphingomicrobium sp.]
MTGATHLYAIAIGSNRPHGRYGSPPKVVEQAIARLEQEFTLFDASRIILNPAIGVGLRDFANAVAIVESELDPLVMLAALKAIEREFGRRPGRRWAPRVLDLDIALWSGGRWISRRLVVPHPQLTYRPFVILPLAAIAASWRIEGSVNARHLAQRLARRAPRR